MRKLHFLHNAFDERIQIAPFLIIRRANIVDAVIQKQVGYLIFLALGIKRNGNTALLFHERHTRNIRDSVPEINHILVCHAAVGHLFIDLLAVRFVKNTLGNTENILRFLRVIDGNFRPNGLSVLVEIILTSKDFRK